MYSQGYILPGIILHNIGIINEVLKFHTISNVNSIIQITSYL